MDELGFGMGELRGMVPRGCRLDPYAPEAVPEFDIRGDFITYASPDATYHVTQQLLEGAQKSILIGIYDFSSERARDLVLAAQRRGVKVSVMVDLDNAKGEPVVWQALVAQGCKGVPAPSCASKFARYFPSCHEKVIVVDGEWVMVQSGNYTQASIPPNGDGAPPAAGAFVPGNRDTGVAIRSPELAAYFSTVLRGDMTLELDGENTRAAGAGDVVEPPPSVRATKPPRAPATLFPSQHYHPGKPVHVTPVISPDNYMQVVPPFLASATRSILIEEQYIRGHQPEVARLLDAIRSAMRAHPKLDVRIVVAPGFGSANDPLPYEGVEDFGLEPAKHVRYLNPALFVHCHNKLIIVDGRWVLVGSQNWSDFAVSRNREASLLLPYPPIARYFTAIFKYDWKTGVVPRRPGGRDVRPAPPEGNALMPESAVSGLELEKTLPVSLADYIEV